jgi:hypothetical protein
MGFFALAAMAPSLLIAEGKVRDFHDRFPSGTPITVTTVGITLGLQMSWALVGLAFAGVYWSIRSNAQNGLGSPAWGYTTVILILAAMSVGVAATIQPSWWRRASVLALLFAGSFGWMLPHLAEA